MTTRSCRLFLWCCSSVVVAAAIVPTRLAYADGEEDVTLPGVGTEREEVTKGSEAKPPDDQSSPNFQKTKRFLPGEEVVTPTGQRMKVWSTEGPVPVSRPPEPYADPNLNGTGPNGVLNGSHIVVETNGLHRGSQDGSGVRRGTAPPPARNLNPGDRTGGAEIPAGAASDVAVPPSEESSASSQSERAAGIARGNNAAPAHVERGAR